MKLYEGMFLVDNEEVRNDWNGAKALVTGVLEKHGAVVRSARLWGERRLAYPIKKRNRATYLLTYFEIEPTTGGTLRRDLDLSEKVLRYLVLAVDEVPEREVELSEAEKVEGFTVPPPPEDDFFEPDSAAQSDDSFDDEPRRPRRSRSDDDLYEDPDEMLAGSGVTEDF